ncbi:MAG: enoyl-[acyl-carrier-protein] reductase FabL [Chloroflexi bacterium]|nr:MAG: enoyl-[acyl-carrier-protein] reductase FabL [Chloroflexota bacterium]MBL1193491.1 enoyl-[acyl-carrier-protein] reductase FabL [Chloroflexota bacterium]NOH10782.1 enoyl-[acyl-carrier-protein] reductase FabL [Chloroflexota bacterium]
METNLTPTNKIALVTGSGRGIGRAIALRLAKDGADLVINYYRNREPAEETAEAVRELGREAIIVKANVGEIEDIEQLFQAAEEHYGGLDFFISNAASGYNRPVMDQRPKGWDWTMNINARSLLFASQQAVPLMEKRGGGVIVSISSPGSFQVLPEYVVVGASKAALEAITRYLAIELAPQNVVVNAVSPGIVATDALNYFETMGQDGLLEELAKDNPTGRLVSVEDVADVVAFLCTPGASMIRGQTILVDGGQTLLPYSSVDPDETRAALEKTSEKSPE